MKRRRAPRIFRRRGTIDKKMRELEESARQHLFSAYSPLTHHVSTYFDYSSSRESTRLSSLLSPLITYPHPRASAQPVATFQLIAITDHPPCHVSIANLRLSGVRTAATSFNAAICLSTHSIPCSIPAPHHRAYPGLRYCVSRTRDAMQH